MMFEYQKVVKIDETVENPKRGSAKVSKILARSTMASAAAAKQAFIQP